MEFAKLLFRFLYRKKWWIIILPILSTILAIELTKDMPKVYSSNTVIYTGVVSGYNLETSLASRVDISQSNNQIENFINIIYSYATLKNVSLKLFAQHMMYGNPTLDNEYIMASHFRPIWEHTPEDIRKLIDPSSEENTIKNLFAADKAEYNNFTYGLFMWNYQYYGKENLEKIQVSRINNSDMIEIKYKSDDPNVVYHTLLLLNEEFLKQYSIIRDNEVNMAIEYFESEIIRIGETLRIAENEQKEYSIKKKIANYEEQTKQIATIESNYKMKLQETKLSYNSSKAVMDEMEGKFGQNFNAIKNNSDFANKLKKVSTLSNELAISTIFNTSNRENDMSSKSDDTKSSSTAILQQELINSENQLVGYIDNYYKYMGSGEVLISQDIATEWLKAVISFEKAKKDLVVLNDIGSEINKLYIDYSPIGVQLKQQERLIGLLENEYKSALDNLNQAKLRKNNNQMSAANLKVITPPQLPLDNESSKRLYYIAGAGFGVLFFIIGLLILIEIVGTNLNDTSRVERLTKLKVIAATPKKYNYILGKYYDAHFKAATQHLSNTILSKVRYKEMNIINFISISPNSGKSDIINNLASHWDSIGRRNRIVNWKEAITKNDREIMYPLNYSDILSLGSEKIILIEHRDISSEIIQKDLLQNAIMNIIVIDSRSSWKDTDKSNLNTLKEQLGDNHYTLFVCMSNATKLTVEEFTDQLPPYNFLSNFSHTIYNMGRTTKRK